MTRACPDCGAPTIRERLPDGRERLLCFDCDWHETRLGGKVVRDPLTPRAEDKKRPKYGSADSPRYYSRPRCLVKGCLCRSDENHLCSSHYSAWCVAGQPADVAAWAAGRTA